MPEPKDNSWQWGLAASILGGMIAGFIVYAAIQLIFEFPFHKGNHASGQVFLAVVLSYAVAGSLVSAFSYVILARRRPDLIRYAGCLVQIITILVMLAGLVASIFISGQRHR